MTGAQHPAVQRLQFFLSESRWDPERVNARRLELLLADPATAPHGGGVLVIDDSGDRKDGTKTAHVGHQWLGRYGKTDNGVVTVTTVWADERLYYPVHAVPYTPARHFAKGKNDPGFRTKLAIGADLAIRAREAGFVFRAVAADSAYGDQDGFRGRARRGRAAVRDGAQAAPRDLGLRPGRAHPGGRGPRAGLGRPGRSRRLAAGDPDLPRRAHRDLVGRRREAGLVGAGRLHRRLVVATADPGTLPDKATWYLATNLPRPGGPREADSVHPAADLAEITRIYGIRHWIEQSYKQVKDELGWADFQVRSDTAIRRHQALVNCAFSFCWAAWFADHPPQHDARHRSRSPAAERGGPRAAGPPPAPSWPRALRAVRAWLSPWIALQRWWAAWSKAPPPPQLQALINSVAAGCGLHLYIRN